MTIVMYRWEEAKQLMRLGHTVWRISNPKLGLRMRNGVIVDDNNKPVTLIEADRRAADWVCR